MTPWVPAAQKSLHDWWVPLAEVFKTYSANLCLDVKFNDCYVLFRTANNLFSHTILRWNWEYNYIFKKLAEVGSPSFMLLWKLSISHSWEFWVEDFNNTHNSLWYLLLFNKRFIRYYTIVVSAYRSKLSLLDGVRFCPFLVDGFAGLLLQGLK